MQTSSCRSMHDPGCSREGENKGLIHSRQMGELLEQQHACGLISTLAEVNREETT